MHRHTCYDLGTVEAGETVEVTLTQNAVNVRLLSKDDYYHRYLEGKSCNFYGGVATQTPYTLTVPSKNHWVLVIDMQGLGGTAGFSVTVSNNNTNKTCPKCGTAVA